MKKFSKLITESKSVTRKMSPLTNPQDWEEIFKPLIDHIDSNAKSNVSGPGNGVFSKGTQSLLNQFLDSVELDYKDYFQSEIHDGSQDSFLSGFDINTNYNDIMECIQSLLDISTNVEEDGDFDLGALTINMSGFKNNSVEEVVEEIADIHGKLKMLNVDFTIIVVNFRDFLQTKLMSGIDLIRFLKKKESLVLKKDLTNVDKTILSGLGDKKIGSVIVCIYNRETTLNSKLYRLGKTLY
jgi:uncharacterized protein YfkK (UPF0435 family)